MHFVKYASCRFHVERQSVSLIPSKLWSQDALMVTVAFFPIKILSEKLFISVLFELYTSHNSHKQPIPHSCLEFQLTKLT